ncbi:MAG: hypothetical protein HYX41_01225 [Bdellovibrio sp.]|nr:hypothetical protein [Bdellovibrio sp.]
MLEGDFREKILACPAPEVVFFDLFSPKHCPDLWGYESFVLLRESMKDSPPSSVVTTYSSSTAVRAALLYAGFVVGYGVSTDAKLQTTVASLSKETLKKPLDDAWFKKRLRSSRPNPHDLPTHLTLTDLRENQLC